MNLPILLLLLLAFSPQRTTRELSAGPYRIEGVVVDATTGAPVAGAQVLLSGDRIGMSVAADDGGHFLFEGLRRGKYALIARAPGYVNARYDQHGPFATAIAVGPGLDSEDVVFRLPREAVIYGTVTDQRGEAVRRARVMLFAEDRGDGTQQAAQQRSATTNDLGQYRFAYLTAGNYYVAVDARPWYAVNGFKYPVEETQGSSRRTFNGQEANALLDVVYPLTFYPSVTDASAASELSVAAGDQDEADIELTAVPAVHFILSGLPDASGGRAPHYAINASRSAFGAPIHLSYNVADREISPGEWEVTGLPPGRVTLSIRSYGTRGSEARTITLDASDGGRIDASNSPAPVAVSGVLISAGGLTAPGRTHVAFSSPRGSQFLTVPVQKNGTFSRMLEPGKYEIHLWRSGGAYLLHVSATGARVAGETVTIPASSNAHFTLTMGRGNGVVNGVAKLASKPDPGVLVLLVPAAGQDVAENSRRYQSDSDGSFTLRYIVPGKYVLMAIARGWKLDWTDPAVLKPYRDKGQVLEIEPGQTQTVTANVQLLVK